MLPHLTEPSAQSSPKEPRTRSRLSSTGCVIAVVCALAVLCGVRVSLTRSDSPADSGAPARSSPPASIPPSPRPAAKATDAEVTEWISHRLTHLRVQAHWHAAALRVDDKALLRDLGEAISELWVGQLNGNEDAIFIGGSVDGNDWRKVRASLNPRGVVWLVYRRRSTPRADVGATAVAAGFERGPSVRYSDDYVAEQFKPRRKARQRAAH